MPARFQTFCASTYSQLQLCRHSLRSIQRFTLYASLSLLGGLVGCVHTPEPKPVVGLLDLTEQPAEKALLTAIRAYDDGQYPEAEKQLGIALQAGLNSPRDRAAAHKYLAFIYCTSQRIGACEVEFRSAIESDPHFVLTKPESGHPLWGPIYRRVRP